MDFEATLAGSLLIRGFIILDRDRNPAAEPSSPSSLKLGKE
jgi:hypothetical protein